ncbi:MAG: DUF4268 domain-containing protein [Bacteroidales bacterium]|nr:DUF4268 domain-containing protein [Bacteroidales bacterium]
MYKSDIVGKMYAYLFECRDVLCPWVDEHFPRDNNWWQRRVVDCFSGQPMRLKAVRKIKDKSFGEMDLAMLVYLVIQKQNWTDLCAFLNWQGNAKKILNDMLAVRNRYSHSSDKFPDMDVVRNDFDTVRTFLEMFGAREKLIRDVAKFRDSLKFDSVKAVSTYEVNTKDSKQKVLKQPKQKELNEKESGQNVRTDATWTIESTPGVLPETRDEREKFWGNYIRILGEVGTPFTVCARNQYAAINLPYPTTKTASPIIEFLTRRSKRLMRVSIYIANDKKTPCYDGMYADKEKIEDTIGHKLIWKNGDKNPDTKRIQYEIKYDEKDVLEVYESIIRESIPIAQKFIEVADEYIPPEYRG